MRSWTMLIPAPDRWLNANDRHGHWSARSGPTRLWREAAAAYARGARIPALERAAITATVHRADRRTDTDAHNRYPTVKAAVDGVVDAGVLPDDCDRYLTALTIEPGSPVDKRRWPLGALQLTVYRIEEGSLMPWFKVDDSFYDHPKVFDLPDAAVALWVRAGCWSARNLTDGKVPSKLLARLCDSPETATDELVSRGLWETDGDGFRFRDWTDYQPSAERVRTTRAARAEAGSRGGKAKAAKFSSSKLPDDGQGPATNTGKQNRTPTRPDPNASKEALGGAQDAPATQKSDKGSRIAEDFWMTEDMIAWGKRECPLVNGTRETEKFVNHWISKTGKDATKKDWVRTWKNWMLKAQEYAEENAERRGDDKPRILAVADERCATHRRQPADNCTICDSEMRGAA